MKNEISLLNPSDVHFPDPAIPVWIHPHWMNAMTEYFGFRAFVLACWRGEHLVALLPLYEKQVFTHRRAVMPMLNYYQPLCLFEIVERPNRAALNQLETTREIAIWLKRYYRRVNICLHPDNYDVRGFTWEGYKASPRYTMYYDPTGTAALFKDEKNALHRAQRQGYQFAEGFIPERFNELLYALYKRKKVDFPIEAKALVGFLSQTHEHGLIRQFNVLKDGVIVSANVVISDRDVVYTWLRASDENELKSGVSVFHSVHLYEILGRQYQSIDMCGANSDSTARFKMGMGGQLKLFFHVRA